MPIAVCYLVALCIVCGAFRFAATKAINQNVAETLVVCVYGLLIAIGLPLVILALGDATCLPGSYIGFKDCRFFPDALADMSLLALFFISPFVILIAIGIRFTCAFIEVRTRRQRGL